MIVGADDGVVMMSAILRARLVAGPTRDGGCTASRDDARTDSRCRCRNARAAGARRVCRVERRASCAQPPLGDASTARARASIARVECSSSIVVGARVACVDDSRRRALGAARSPAAHALAVVRGVHELLGEARVVEVADALDSARSTPRPRRRRGRARRGPPAPRRPRAPSRRSLRTTSRSMRSSRSGPVSSGVGARREPRSRRSTRGAIARSAPVGRPARDRPAASAIGPRVGSSSATPSLGRIGAADAVVGRRASRPAGTVTGARRSSVAHRTLSRSSIAATHQAGRRAASSSARRRPRPPRRLRRCRASP